MNWIAVVILITLLVDCLLNLCADILNLKALKKEIPHGFKDVYDPERYRQSQEYLKINTRFSWITDIFDLLILLVFWFGKGFPFLDQYARSFGYGPIVTGLIFIGILIFAKTLLSLPFSIYSTFVIEEKFGFNKTTSATFIKDLLKGLGLGIILGGGLLAGIMSFLQYSGDLAWLYCWGASIIFILILQFIMPTWIMPLFNKFEPLEDGELKTAILEYAQSVDFSLANVMVMDGSKRSSKSNAFFTGFGKNKRIALFDTLIKQHSIPELVAVLAHEIGHYKKKHIIKTMLIGFIQMGLMFYLLSICLSYQDLFAAFYMQNQSVYAGLLFFGMLAAPFSFFMGLGMQIWSRKNEYEADYFAGQSIAEPAALAWALKKLVAHNLGNLEPHPLFVFLNYSHPPVIERINRLV